MPCTNDVTTPPPAAFVGRPSSANSAVSCENPGSGCEEGVSFFGTSLDDSRFLEHIQFYAVSGQASEQREGSAWTPHLFGLARDSHGNRHRVGTADVVKSSYISGSREFEIDDMPDFDQVRDTLESTAMEIRAACIACRHHR